MTYDIIALKETSVFVRPHENESGVFQQKFHLGLFSKTCAFGARKCCFSVLVDERLETEKKISVFKNVRVDVDRT